MPRTLVAVACMVGVISTVAPALGQLLPPSTTLARRPEGTTSVGTRAVPVRGTTVMGFAWSATNDPIPDATVRLRNVLTGTVEATVVTSATGEFVFENIEGGATYVVELVSESGHVRALGHPFALAPGETVATFVRLGVPTPWLGGLFGNTAAAAVSTAAAVGVAAVVPPGQPISATR